MQLKLETLQVPRNFRSKCAGHMISGPGDPHIAPGSTLQINPCFRVCKEGRVNTAVVSTLGVVWRSWSSHVSDPHFAFIIWNWSLCPLHWHSHKKATVCVQQYLISRMAPGSSTEKGCEQRVRSSSLNLVYHTIGVLFLWLWQLICSYHQKSQTAFGDLPYSCSTQMQLCL